MSDKSNAASIRKSLRELGSDAVVSAASPSEADSIRNSLTQLGVNAQVTDK